MRILKTISRLAWRCPGPDPPVEPWKWSDWVALAILSLALALVYPHGKKPA
jgi:hypothetical protein